MVLVMGSTVPTIGNGYNYLGRNGSRAAPQDLAHQAPAQPARPRARGRRLHAPSELPGDRPLTAERADGPAPRRAARGAAARAQPAAARRRLRADLLAAPAGGARAGPRRARPAAAQPRAVPGDRRR